VNRTPLQAALEGARALASDLGVEVAADYGDQGAEERALIAGAGLVDRCVRGAVRVAGPEALSYLHSLLSQEVAGLGPGEGTHTLLLQPQGKLDVDLRLLVLDGPGARGVPEDTVAWLDCEVGRGEALAASLRRFKIRVKAEVEEHTGAWGCLFLRGPEGSGVVEKAAGVAVPGAAHAHATWPGTALRVVRADWPGGLPGVDIVGPVAELEAAWAALTAAGATPAGLTAHEAVRVAAGLPRQGLDIDERTIPQEAFLERDAVSFTKGCFLGQELVCRIDTRGHVNRFLRGFRLTGGPYDTTPPSGAGILLGDKEVGALTSVATSESGVLALGYLRREVELPAEVLVRWEGGQAPALASALPERA
jgi:folate-binding protein YgfZ